MSASANRRFSVFVSPLRLHPLPHRQQVSDISRRVVSREQRPQLHGSAFEAGYTFGHVVEALLFDREDHDLGSVEEGKLADLVLLNANPVADISNAQDIAMVVKGGVVIDRKALALPVNRR